MARLGQNTSLFQNSICKSGNLAEWLRGVSWKAQWSVISSAFKDWAFSASEVVLFCLTLHCLMQQMVEVSLSYLLW
jgi:hypothetical protein